jgi:acetyl-CoA carboxylase biotin carboxyl carrier protein
MLARKTGEPWRFNTFHRLQRKMDLNRLKEILDWMAKSPVVELEISDGDFEVRLVRDAGGTVAATRAAEPSTGREVVAATHGVIHLSPAPGSAPFVQVGQAVAVGQTLCVIEAMKVFSPIEADRAGTVAAILVADGAEVAAGQKLFRLD